MRRMAPCATTQYRQRLAAEVATMIISFSPLLRPEGRSSSASWYAKKARNSSGRWASTRNTLGTKPDFSCTPRMRARMSSGRSASSGTGQREMGGGVLIGASSGLELQRVQAGEQAALGEQLGVRALLDDAAGLHHHDAVCAFDGRQWVGD